MSNTKTNKHGIPFVSDESIYANFMSVTHKASGMQNKDGQRYKVYGDTLTYTPFAHLRKEK